jgi:hypothetical protein
MLLEAVEETVVVFCLVGQREGQVMAGGMHREKPPQLIVTKPGLMRTNVTK